MEHGVKKKKILVVFLTAALVLALFGCATGQSLPAAQEGAPVEASAAAPAEPTEAPADAPAEQAEVPAEVSDTPTEEPEAADAPAALSPFAGNWKLCAQEGDIISFTHEELEAQAAESGLDLASVMSATLREDGTLSLCIYGMLAEGVWTDSGDGSGVFTVNGQDCDMNVADGLLRVDMKAYVCVFEPGELSAEEAAAAVPEMPVVGYEPPEQKHGDPRLVGEWRFYDRESDDPQLRVAHEDLPKLKQQGKDYAADCTLSIGDDGWFKATDFYGFERNNWTDNGDGTGTLFVDGETCQISAEDGFLLLTASDSVTRYERTAELGDPMAEDEEDMLGFVLEKLAGDHFPRLYLVLAVNGETYQCQHYGFEELEPGTEVRLSPLGKSWRIEPADDGLGFSSGPAAETPPPLYTTADGITLDDPVVRLAGGRLWSFAYTLANPTDKDAEFDPSLFVLKRADGTELRTMAGYVSRDQVQAGTTYYRVSITIGKADAVRLGEEISFWYDGTFLGTVTASEF